MAVNTVHSTMTAAARAATTAALQAKAAALAVTTATAVAATVAIVVTAAVAIKETVILAQLTHRAMKAALAVAMTVVAIAAVVTSNVPRDKILRRVKGLVLHLRIVFKRLAVLHLLPRVKTLALVVRHAQRKVKAVMV
jgi:hypothetical protein